MGYKFFPYRKSYSLTCGLYKFQYVSMRFSIKILNYRYNLVKNDMIYKSTLLEVTVGQTESFKTTHYADRSEEKETATTTTNHGQRPGKSLVFSSIYRSGRSRFSFSFDALFGPVQLFLLGSEGFRAPVSSDKSL